MKGSGATLLRVTHWLLTKLNEKIDKDSVKHYIGSDKNTEQQKVPLNTLSLLFIYFFLTKPGRTAAERTLTLYTIETVQDKPRGQSPQGPNGRRRHRKCAQAISRWGRSARPAETHMKAALGTRGNFSEAGAPRRKNPRMGRPGERRAGQEAKPTSPGDTESKLL